MTIKEQRISISSVYPTEQWKHTVANMKENQVTAIYFAFKKRGILGKVITEPHQRKKSGSSHKKTKSNFYQITMDEFLN